MKIHQGRAIVFVEDIVDLHAIAERSGATREAIQKWRQRFEDFPEPILQLGSGNTGAKPIWDWSQVVVFLEEHPRLGLVR